jgi:hypothetical protein
VLRLAAEIATDVHPDQPHRAQLADTMSDETLTQEDPAGHPQGPRPVARGQELRMMAPEQSRPPICASASRTAPSSP